MIPRLRQLKWLTAILVIAFLLVFEYLRHFIWPELLHAVPVYIVSLAFVFALILLFNQTVYGMLEKMQQSLVEQTTYLNTLIESSGNAIITSNLDGKILLWNRGAEQIYEWTRLEAIGQTLPMVPPELRDEARQLLARLVASGEPIYNYETQRLRKSGDRLPVMVTVSPIRDANGKAIALLGISTDMRERKRLEQEVLRQRRPGAGPRLR
ncbi:MAG: PAS domain S-box protein [Chloroflexi bacterium]|nr:PAS domain S-box protein [Chloroflexota bacterium]